MLDGFAFCADDDDYQHTYLDNIKIKDVEYDDTKPVYIDKLFENEDAFLQAPCTNHEMKNESSNKHTKNKI